MSENLLPCPFCGHDTPEFERMGDRRQSCIVICGWCGARHESSDEGDRCGSSWNQRAEPSQDGLRTALETALARIEDMLADDDGQAFKEARKFLPVGRAALAAQPGAVPSLGEIRDAVALGWCSSENLHKEMDADLVRAIADEVSKLLAAAPTEAKPAQPCGHQESLLLKSAETGEPLYCEACDDKSGRRDAEQRETELLAVNQALREKIAALSKPAQDAVGAALAYLDDLKDDAAAHIFPDDLERCMTSECEVQVASVRMGSPDGMTVPLFSRDQVADAIRAAISAKKGQP